MEAARALLALWREGKVSLADSWDDPAASVASERLDDQAALLAQQVREAKSVEDLAAVAQEVGARVAEGGISVDVARALRDTIQEARVGRLAHSRDPLAPFEGDEERMVLATAEAVQLARALDYMVDEKRRTRVQEFVARELEQDVVEHPNVDSAGAR